jgi:hypothetical protein
MATQVPYDPTSKVEFDSRPQSAVRVDAPLAAFGGNVADAVKGLGNTFANVGSELYDRAVAMQTLNEQAKATAATADFMTQLGEKWAQFKTLQGDAAVAAQPKFTEELNALRAKQRESLTSPYAQRAFDNETRPQQARTVMSAADHAASQNRKFIQDASNARVAANNIAVLSNPRSQESYEAGLISNRQEIESNSLGKPPEVTQLAIQQANSQLALNRAKSLAEEDPVAARRFIDEEKKKGRLVGEDIAKADAFVRMKLNARTAADISRETTSGRNLAIGGRTTSPSQAAEAIGENRSFHSVEPGKSENNPLLGKYGVAEQNLGPLLRQAGMPVMTKDEFLANPQAQEKLFKATFDRLQKDKGSFNAAYEEWRKQNPAKTNATPADLIELNRRLAKKASRSELDEAAREQARRIDTDPELQERASQQTQLAKTRQQQQERDETTRATQIITARLNERGPGGKLISSEEELLDTPERRAAWDSMPETTRKSYLRTLEANARGGYAATPDNQAKFMGIRGAMLDPNITQDQRDELLSMNIGALEMPAAQRQVLVTMQAKLLKDAIKAPNVTAAMRVLAPQLNALGITQANDKEGLASFRGQLAGIIEDRMAELKRPLTPKEIQEAGQLLLRDRTYSRWMGLNNTHDKSFKAPIPDKDREAIIQAYKKDKPSSDPTDEEIRMIYSRRLANRHYQQLYGSKPKIPDRAQ